MAGNRDEFYTRRTRPAAWWGQAVSLLAGQDEEAGGTWFGITRRGRLAALTNVRAPSERNPHAPSRGALVVAALQTPERVDRWLDRHAHRTPAFNGFNLLAGDVMPTDGNAAGFAALLQQPARRAAPHDRAWRLWTVERVSRHALAQGEPRRRPVRLHDREPRAHR